MLSNIGISSYAAISGKARPTIPSNLDSSKTPPISSVISENPYLSISIPPTNTVSWLISP